jgi:hypothetical protein
MNSWVDRYFTTLVVAYVIVSVGAFASLLGML